jgi:hypothetical protein
VNDTVAGLLPGLAETAVGAAGLGATATPPGSYRPVATVVWQALVVQPAGSSATRTKRPGPGPRYPARPDTPRKRTSGQTSMACWRAQGPGEPKATWHLGAARYSHAHAAGAEHGPRRTAQAPAWDPWDRDAVGEDNRSG